MRAVEVRNRLTEIEDQGFVDDEPTEYIVDKNHIRHRADNQIEGEVMKECKGKIINGVCINDAKGECVYENFR